MNYLKQLPLDPLETDRNFTRDIMHGGTARTLIAAMLNIAHTLRLSVVAEGVDIADQYNAVRAFGCA